MSISSSPRTALVALAGLVAGGAGCADLGPEGADAPVDVGTSEAAISNPALPHVAFVRNATVGGTKYPTMLFTRSANNTLLWKPDPGDWRELPSVPVASDVAAAVSSRTGAVLIANLLGDGTVAVHTADGATGVAMSAPTGHPFVGHPAIVYQTDAGFSFGGYPADYWDKWRVFARDASGGIWERDLAPGTLALVGGWGQLAVPTAKSDPFALTDLTNKLDLFFVATDSSSGADAIYRQPWSFGTVRSTWEAGSFVVAPAAGVVTDWIETRRVTTGKRDLTLYVQTKDGKQAGDTYSDATKTWTGWSVPAYGNYCANLADDGNMCTADGCDPVLGEVVATPMPIGSSCVAVTGCNEIGRCNALGGCDALVPSSGQTCAPVALTLGQPYDAWYVQPQGGTFRQDYTVTAPTDQGEGYLTITIGSFDPQGGVSFQLLANKPGDVGQIVSGGSASAGADIRRYVAVEPGAAITIDLTPAIGMSLVSHYVVSTSFTPFGDPGEPSDSTSDGARAIALGQTASALMVTGYDGLSRVNQQASWDDWYRVDLPAGESKALTVTIANAPANLSLSFTVLSLDKSQQYGGATIWPGGSVTSASATTPYVTGGVLVRVNASPIVAASWDGNLPAEFSQRYTVTVTAP